MTENNSDIVTRAIEYIREKIPRLEKHLLGTQKFALEINRTHSLGYSDETVSLAAVCHDFARLVNPDEMSGELIKRGVDPAQFNAAKPILLHGALSAELAKENLGLSDVEILDAITWHATGRSGMTNLDKIVYIADKIECNRSREGVEDLRREVRKDFDKGFNSVLGAVLRYVIAQGWPVDYNSVAAWNEAVNVRGGNSSGDLNR